MRIWSIHPRYLDGKGLVALWREALLARQVLNGKTKGYKNHPQLERFKAAPTPTSRIDQYLSAIYQEAVERGYHFNEKKFVHDFIPRKMTVTRGQMKYETAHLLKKLKKRDAKKYRKLASARTIAPHPMFIAVRGGIEDWEKIE